MSKSVSMIAVRTTALLGFLALGLSSCVPSLQNVPLTIPQTYEPSYVELQADYIHGVADASVAEVSEINNQLTAIVPSNRNLAWDGQGRVKMVTWTSWNGYDALVGQDTTVGRETWLTAAPELKNFCTAYAVMTGQPSLDLRLEQLLGLPPRNGKTKMVEMWVNPADMFRPSADPEVTDTTAGVVIPPVGAFASLAAYDAHVAWFNNLKNTSYDLQTGYPWTRLGYTYDWNNSFHNVGLSEFVVRANSKVSVANVYTTSAYCGK